MTSLELKSIPNVPEPLIPKEGEIEKPRKFRISFEFEYNTDMSVEELKECLPNEDMITSGWYNIDYDGVKLEEV